VSFLFQGSSLDIYIHWLIVLLGAGILVFGIAVLASCRSVAGAFNLLEANNSKGHLLYKRFYKYHHVYWMIFWVVLILHLMATITHVGLPTEPYFYAHQAVFFSSIGNFIFLMVVLFSCRTTASLLNLSLHKSPLSNNVYKKFYGYHSYFWWLLAVSLGVHIVSGIIHAVNT
jgi:hypothetical protein